MCSFVVAKISTNSDSVLTACSLRYKLQKPQRKGNRPFNGRLSSLRVVLQRLFESRPYVQFVEARDDIIITITVDKMVFDWSYLIFLLSA